MKQIFLYSLLLVMMHISFTPARGQSPDLPLIGAQVFIEPGQTPAQVEQWFHVLQENGMKVCRIRLHESHMHKANGSWDFSIYDHAFRTAEKYGVKVFATLYPATKELGGDKFPYDEQNFREIAVFIQQAVSHFRQFPALYCWVLQNEPGVNGKLPPTPFTTQKLKEWQAQQPPAPNAFAGDLDPARFLLQYEAWYLGWLAAEVQKYDPDRPRHLNNHRTFDNIAEYDFPAWRSFLTSLGASIHPSWHFGYFSRQQYALAVAANCAIIRSGAGPLPFWVTELQGGTNIYSAFQPLCPTKAEIAQWLWTSIGSGARGVIFWTLNPRLSGKEAGEWGMLDYQDQPTDRVLTTRDVIAAIGSTDFFRQALPLPSPVHILYTRSSLWTEALSQWSNPDGEPEGRSKGAVIKSTLACYEVLAENGIDSHLGEMSEFDWARSDYSGEVIILANQVSIPTDYRQKLYDFTAKGGKLIVTGLTGLFDEHWQTVTSSFPFEKLFGGALKEIRCLEKDTDLSLEPSTPALPVHLFWGTIHNTEAIVIGRQGEEITATRHGFGKGEVVWVPSLIELGARRKDNRPLSTFLMRETAAATGQLAFRFEQQQPHLLMKVMQSGNNFVTIVVNKSTDTRQVRLKMPAGLERRVLYTNQPGATGQANLLSVAPEATLVIEWRKK